MNYTVSVRPEAEADLEDAIAWYESRSIGLGTDFVRCIDAAFASIARDPEIHAKQYREIRRALVRKFPFGVFYLVHEGTIQILAVVHVKRHPSRWKNRSR
jgi:plasmid stabilization system protein ParE